MLGELSSGKAFFGPVCSVVTTHLEFGLTSLLLTLSKKSYCSPSIT